MLQGGADNDQVQDSGGQNLLDGGSGDDVLTGASGNEVFIGGTGNDMITTGSGADLILFNRGDGQDVINASIGPDNTLSIGGGIRYSDLSLSKSGKDLVLDAGNGDSATLKNWYAASNYHSVLNLQVIADAMADFDASGTDPLRNNKVEQFNFAGLVGRFDQARAANPTLTSWSLTNALLDFHTGDSDIAAIGGDLAYQYDHAGSLAGIGVSAAQNVLGNAQMGTAAQTLQPLANLQEGVVKLAA